MHAWDVVGVCDVGAAQHHAHWLDHVDDALLDGGVEELPGGEGGAQLGFKCAVGGWVWLVVRWLTNDSHNFDIFGSGVWRGKQILFAVNQSSLVGK